MKRIFLVGVVLLTGCFAARAAEQQAQVDYSRLSVQQLTPLAEKGDAEAQNNLGVRYATGRGVPKDDVEAVKWLRKAADQNYAEAQCSLGVCYWIGKGVPKNVAESAKWFRKAAEQNNAYAQYSLGGNYWLGLGVPKDYVEAYRWLNLAAAQGNEDARKNRDTLEKEMTPEQIAEGQKLSREFKPKQQ